MRLAYEFPFKFEETVFLSAFVLTLEKASSYSGLGMALLFHFRT
jgi:hypothetical protein